MIEQILNQMIKDKIIRNDQKEFYRNKLDNYFNSDNIPNWLEDYAKLHKIDLG